MSDIEDKLADLPTREEVREMFEDFLGDADPDHEELVYESIGRLEPTDHDEVAADTGLPKEDVREAIRNLVDKKRVRSTLDWNYVTYRND